MQTARKGGKNTLPRRYDSEDAKRRILSSCVRLFILKGYRETTLADVMAEADVSSSSFRNIFGTKDGILSELVDVMFEGQFEMAGSVLGNTSSPAMLYAVETAIQLTITERNENLREIYLEAYAHPDLAEQIHRKTAGAVARIFRPYLPECTDSDFYEMEIGTAGIMTGYMARRCDIYFTLERKLERFLRMALGAYQVPKPEQDAIVSQICKLDICQIADSVMQKLFAALAMKFDFSLNPAENLPS